MEIVNDTKKYFRGVSKSRNKWRARISHPKLKIDVNLGTYDNPEKAALVYKQKKAEFMKMYGSRYSSLSNSRKCKNGYKCFKKTSCDIVTTSEFSDQLNDDLKVPRGVRRLKSGRWCARIAEVAGNLEKADESPISGFPTSVLGSDNSNSISINDKAKLGVRVIDAPGKLEHTLGQSSSMTGFEPGNMNSSDVSDRNIMSKGKEQNIGCISDFDEAVSLGFINEYGQLVGMYSELDEQMEFSQPDEDVRDCFDGCSISIFPDISSDQCGARK